IFELRTPVAAALRTEIRDLVDEARISLGYRPELVLDGPIDSAVPDDLRPTLLAVLREALSNVARHARASAVQVRVSASGRRLALEVTDNGVGTGDSVPSGGLRNLNERAAELQGGFEVLPAQP